VNSQHTISSGDERGKLENLLTVCNHFTALDRFIKCSLEGDVANDDYFKPPFVCIGFETTMEKRFARPNRSTRTTDAKASIEEGLCRYGSNVAIDSADQNYWLRHALSVSIAQCKDERWGLRMDC